MPFLWVYFSSCWTTSISFIKHHGLVSSPFVWSFLFCSPLERVVRYETQLTAIFPSSLKFSGSVSQWQGANGTKGQRQQELPPNRKLRRFVRLSAYFLPEHFLIFGQLDTLWATYTSISSTPHTNMHIAPSLDHALS